MSHFLTDDAFLQNLWLPIFPALCLSIPFLVTPLLPVPQPSPKALNLAFFLVFLCEVSGAPEFVIRWGSERAIPKQAAGHSIDRALEYGKVGYKGIWRLSEQS